MAYGWEGERVRLVPLDEARHLANALAWLNDPQVTEWTLVGDTPITRLGEEAYFRRMSEGTEKDVAFAVETLDGEHVGFCALNDIEWRHGVARTGTIIGRRELWRSGLGGEVARLRARYAFDVLGLRLLLSAVMDGNAASERMLLRTGYREVGRIPGRYFKRGAYRDEIIFALERPPVG